MTHVLRDAVLGVVAMLAIHRCGEIGAAASPVFGEIKTYTTAVGVLKVTLTQFPSYTDSKRDTCTDACLSLGSFCDQDGCVVRPECFVQIRCTHIRF